MSILSIPSVKPQIKTIIIVPEGDWDDRWQYGSCFETPSASWFQTPWHDHNYEPPNKKEHLPIYLFIYLFIQFFNMYIIYKVQIISVNDVERSRQVAALVPVH